MKGCECMFKKLKLLIIGMTLMLNVYSFSLTQVVAQENLEEIDQKILELSKNKENKDIFNSSYHTANSRWEKTIKSLKAKFEYRTLATDDYFANIYLEDLLEEEYIVDLVNSMSDKKTTLDNWKFNREFLIKNYENIKKLELVNLVIVDKYIMDYETVLLSENNQDENIEKKFASSKSSATFKARVKQYVDAHWNNYNPNYPNYSSMGGDCANFVSQCLHYAGKNMVGTPGISNAQDFNNWFCQGNVHNSKLVSSTWRGADAFKWFWKSRTTTHYIDSNMIGPPNMLLFEVGDAISITNANKKAIHTMIVYSTSGKVLLAAHSSNTKSANLLEKYDDYGGGCYLYKM